MRKGDAVMSQDDIQGQQSSDQKHRMSIALTIGMIGLILLLYGLFVTADYSRSDGININLWWGLLMLVFGILMSIVGYISSRRQVTH
jgi:uncharacterized membrane protein